MICSDKFCINFSTFKTRRALGRVHYLRQRSLSNSSVNTCFCCAWPWPLTLSFYKLLSSSLS